MIELPECDPDPEIDGLLDQIDEITMRRCREAMAANEAADERRRERASIRTLLEIAQYGTKQELYEAMCQAFGPGRLR
jgi:hypothetical protein